MKRGIHLLTITAEAGIHLRHTADIIISQRISTLPRDGQYHLQLRAWDYPMGTGAYTLSLFTDTQPPTLQLIYPQEDSFIPQESLVFTATASDTGSGIHKVTFWWHDDNWQTGSWAEIGTDTDGADGWSAHFDASVLPELSFTWWWTTTPTTSTRKCSGGQWSAHAITCTRRPPKSGDLTIGDSVRYYHPTSPLPEHVPQR